MIFGEQLSRVAIEILACAGIAGLCGVILSMTGHRAWIMRAVLGLCVALALLPALRGALSIDARFALWVTLGIWGVLLAMNGVFIDVADVIGGGAIPVRFLIVMLCACGMIAAAMIPLITAAGFAIPLSAGTIAIFVAEWHRAAWMVAPFIATMILRRV